jgi:hypothetical protein
MSRSHNWELLIVDCRRAIDLQAVVGKQQSAMSNRRSIDDPQCAICNFQS